MQELHVDEGKGMFQKLKDGQYGREKEIDCKILEKLERFMLRRVLPISVRMLCFT